MQQGSSLIPGSKIKLGVVRDFESQPFVIEDRIDILAEIMRFATYKNLSLVARKKSDSDTEENDQQENVTEESDKELDDMDIEFIGKRAYNKDKVTFQDPATSASKKIKPVFQKKDKQKSDMLEDTIKQMTNIYQLFNALDGLNPRDIDQYLEDTCNLKRFSGVMILRQMITPQCLLFEVVGLIRKKYHIIIEKELLSYIPRDYFRKGQIYLFFNLIINFAKKERVVVFMLDTQSSGKFCQFVSYSLVRHLSNLQPDNCSYRIPLCDNLMKEMQYGVMDLTQKG